MWIFDNVKSDLPFEFEITSGEVSVCPVVLCLIGKLPGAKALVADKDYDGECIREQITKKEAQGVYREDAIR